MRAAVSLMFLLIIMTFSFEADAVETDAENDLETTPANSSDDRQLTMDGPALSREASQILTRMTDFISAAPAFYVVADSGNEVLQQDGQLLEFGAHFTLTIQRPSQANLRVDSRDGTTATTILDGDAISVFRVIENIFYYDTTRQPGDINESLNFLATQLGVPRQLPFILSKDFTASLSRVQSGYYVGGATIAGVPCDHLALRSEKLDVQLWIAKGNEPVPRRMIMMHREVEGRPRVWLQSSDWDFSPELSDHIFILSPPQDAERFRYFAGVPGEDSE